MAKKEFANGFRGGSALILAVVLTSLLAVIGMMFLMTARIDRMSTSGISENRDLDSAVEAVIAKISNELAMDVPDANTVPTPEYYDYPGDNDRWLASLEPYNDNGTYKWSQISDVTGYIGSSEQEDVAAEIVKDHNKIELDLNGKVESDEVADADGDGVADSKWIELEGMTSSKGETIYAAVRVIDKGGMLNVNTAYQFNPASPGPDGEFIDGSDQMQINLFGLAQRSATNTIDDLDDMRFGSELQDQENYLREVVWRYDIPDGNYTPFDISDELELRNRFTLNRSDVDSRIEEVWDSAFQALNYLRTPVDDSDAFTSWKEEVYYDYEVNDPNIEDAYSYRHIGTIYNMDRIINPAGDKMLNINTIVDANTPMNMIYRAIRAGLPDSSPTFPDADKTAAQIAVNLVDFRDTDSEVSFIEVNDVNGTPGAYYGFETPCIYISELAHRFVLLTISGAPLDFLIRKSYAIELYKPYEEDVYPDPNQRWRLSIEDYPNPNSPIPIPINWSGSERFHIVRFEDPCAPLIVNFDPNYFDPNRPAPLVQQIVLGFNTNVFEPLKDILLERWVEDANQWVAVDSVEVPNSVGGWLPDSPVFDGITHSVQRDIGLHRCIRRSWDSGESTPVTLGGVNIYAPPTPFYFYIQAHPENRDFRNVGEIGKLFRADVYGRNWGTFDSELDVRLNLADPNYQNLFQYLTVMDPTQDGYDNDGDGVGEGVEIDDSELKVPGRININTAPWFVIRQLPWMETEIAQAIVAYRDKLNMNPNGPNYSDRGTQTGIEGLREEEGFASTGELATVISESGYDAYSMNYYALPPRGDLLGYPDLTPGDDAPDDFEEQDVIFSRISDLVTVRSDVFSAYILVRIGVDGPQKRAMAILDRSNVYSSGDRVRVIAVQPASDPR